MATLNTAAASRNTKSQNLSSRQEKDTRKAKARLGQNRKVTVDRELLGGMVEDLGLANLLALQEIVAKRIVSKLAETN